MTSSKPPGLGSIRSEPRLMSTLIVIDLVDEDDNEFFEILSEPPGIGSGLISSEPLLSTSLTSHGENFVADISVLKKFKYLFGEAEFEDSLNDNGVDVASTVPPGLGPIPDESIVIEIRSEPPGLCSIPSKRPLSTSIASHGETTPESLRLHASLLDLTQIRVTTTMGLM